MKRYEDLTVVELKEELEMLLKEVQSCKKDNLSLNMARGKPSSEQLNLSLSMLNMVNSESSLKDELDGSDCRNYGELKGTMEARKLFGEYLGVPKEQTIVVGSASLTFMYDCMARAMLKGVLGSERAWIYERPKFLCPVPGYDRHFSICEFLGIEMISIPMNEDGPDMDKIESLIEEDESIKGMWCVPKYSNPTGITYSDDVIRRMARMKPKAKDFRVFCDNAYAVHKIYEDTPLLNIIEEFAKAGNPNMIYVFGSTNKITFSGAGVAMFAASQANVDFTEKQLSMQAISWDKLNMLRHVRFLKDLEGIKEQMDKHAAILRPKFEVVVDMLECEIVARGAGAYIKPMGGYFVTYQAPNGCAKKIVERCKEMGLVLTDAGATHPYGIDPDDSFIRIAPSFPSVDSLMKAMEIFCVAARIASVEKLLGS